MRLKIKHFKFRRPYTNTYLRQHKLGKYKILAGYDTCDMEIEAGTEGNVISVNRPGYEYMGLQGCDLYRSEANSFNVMINSAGTYWVSNGTHWKPFKEGGVIDNKYSYVG